MCEKYILGQTISGRALRYQRLPTSDACQKKPHLMGLLSINCCLLVKLYITLEQKFFKTDECCIKTCFYCGIINIF